MHEQDGGSCVCDDGRRDTAAQVAQRPTTAVRPDDDQTCFALFSRLDNPLPGWRCLDHHAL